MLVSLHAALQNLLECAVELAHRGSSGEHGFFLIKGGVSAGTLHEARDSAVSARDPHLEIHPRHVSGVHKLGDHCNLVHNFWILNIASSRMYIWNVYMYMYFVWAMFLFVCKCLTVQVGEMGLSSRPGRQLGPALSEEHV